jgi:glycosyltransferase involved in cell wall biosynthesis
MLSNDHQTTNRCIRKIQISIVVPVYNEEENLCKLYDELSKVLTVLDTTWEVVFVDDGSKDKTWKVIADLNKRNDRIKGIQFSRNFGHQYALLAGLKGSQGQAIICMDADLQHPPEVIPKLIAEWKKGYKIVNTIRLDSEKLSAFKKTTSKLFYSVFSFLSGVRLEKGMADFRLFDRQALDTITQFGEQGLFLRGIVQWVGFPSSKIVFKSADRFGGVSKYTFKKMLRFALDGITSFSIVPLRLGIVIGIITSLVAFAQMIYGLYAKIVLEATVPGWATTITVLSFMFGILFILLGLVGEYIGRILTEVRVRPRFIINEQIGQEELICDVSID